MTDKDALEALLNELRDCALQYDPDDPAYSNGDRIIYCTGELRQALQPQWQPIETAPKDGTDILAIGKVGDKWSVRHILYFEECENRGWLCSRKHEPVSHLPTHWMPLPTPPSENK